MLVYFARGRLPWQGVRGADRREKYAKIREMKMGSVDALCEGLPLQLSVYFKYCRTLRFEDTPNYEYLKQLFVLILRKSTCELDWIGKFRKKELSDIEAIKRALNSGIEVHIEETKQIKKQPLVNKVLVQKQPKHIQTRNTNRVPAAKKEHSKILHTSFMPLQPKQIKDDYTKIEHIQCDKLRAKRFATPMAKQFNQQKSKPLPRVQNES
eukprot:TRINITY_DN8173_c0_g2_i2.p1 TRINITY_DN8173_c0_g2~~TRINITY_DN8173_c0_g2_i2.p1  ORF type:complete len:210 (+),score=37.11 TRINITY_DN8173_c0_g2_i2:126-755(+)